MLLQHKEYCMSSNKIRYESILLTALFGGQTGTVAPEIYHFQVHRKDGLLICRKINRCMYGNCLLNVTRRNVRSAPWD